VVVLEGIARTGAVAGITDGVTVPHTPGSCDEMLIAVTADATTQVTLCQPIVALRQRAEALGADAAGPGWLVDVLDR
jgi:hypothetical protein